MNEKEVIRDVMKKKGFTQTLVAEKAGLKRQSNVSEMLRGSSLRVANLVMLMEAMDCEVVVRSKTSVMVDGKATKPEWKITLND